MEFEYRTERLILKILSPSVETARQVLNFHNKNRALFERYEGARPVNFYTEAYQKTLLSCEYNLTIQKKCVRFWVFEQDNPDEIIGTVSFYHILHGIYDRCETGYKFDPSHWHKGYAKEALAFGISFMFEEFGMHRIEAMVMPDNDASIRLLSGLNFEYEGTCRKSIRIRGEWEDHMLYSLIQRTF